LKEQLNPFNFNKYFYQIVFQLIFLYTPIHFLVDRKIFQNDSAFLEKYIFIFTPIALIFIFLIFEKDKNYYLQNIQFFILLLFTIIYTKYLYYDNSIFFNESIEQSFITNLFFLIMTAYFIEKNYDFNKFLLVQFIVFLSLFHIEILGLYVIFLYYRNKFDFNLSKKEFIFFKFIPLISIASKLLFSISKKFDIFWFSLIRKPHSGSSRFYDMQWNLLYMKCNQGSVGGEYIRFGSYMECPEIYSPIYKYITHNYNLHTLSLFIYLFLLILISIAYIKLFQKFPAKKNFIVLAFLSPPLNFMLYQGNFDFLPFIALLFIYTVFNKKTYLNLILLFVVSLFEIHPITFLLGFAILFFIKHRYKELSFAIALMLSFIFYLFYDFSLRKFSNSYLVEQFSTNSYLSDIYSSYGLKIDLSIISSTLSVNVYLLIFTVVLLLIFFTKLFNINLILEDEYTIPLALGFFASVVLENPVYRLAVYILLFIFIFNKENKNVNYLLLFSLFLNPTPLIEFENSLEFHVLSSYSQLETISEYIYLALDQLDVSMLLLNRIGLYVLFAILLKTVLVEVINSKLSFIKRSIL